MIFSFQFTQSRLGCQAGVSAVEYCILLALVGGLAVAGLKLFGGSTAILLSNSSNRLSQHNTLSLLEPSHSNTPFNLPGSGYYALLRNPKTGETGLKMVGGNQVSETNVTSVEGDDMHTLGTVMISNSLAQLAEKEQEPQLKAYYSKLAELSYYLGGAQGELDAVDGLDLAFNQGDSGYTRGDGLRDIYQYQKELGALMENPPDNLNLTSFNEVMPLASTVYNIAQKYLNTFNQYITSNGEVTQNFGNPNTCGTGRACLLGNGEPGSAFLYADQTALVGRELLNKSYRDLVDLDTLKEVSSKLLKRNQVDSEPVKSTLTNAGEIDQYASETPETLLSPKVEPTSIKGLPETLPVLKSEPTSIKGLPETLPVLKSEPTSIKGKPVSSGV